MASNISSMPRLGCDTLTESIQLYAGGSALNSTVHGANFSSAFDIPVSFELFTATGLDVQVRLLIRV
jgi:hypothetical protein